MKVVRNAEGCNKLHIYKSVRKIAIRLNSIIIDFAQEQKIFIQQPVIHWDVEMSSKISIVEKSFMMIFV